ncbi:MAG TPA: Gfo/Idh/MocA family oxidoreductase, partial [Limnochordia bacterium]|nr:Gfo/Idh/MocA family oxidoreductase [Limnochordia bacterium]
MIRAAVVGYGNIGKFAVQAVQAAPDLELVGVVRRKVEPQELPPELQGLAVVDDVTKLGQVDVALLCVPSRSVPQKARELVELGINPKIPPIELLSE